MTHIMQIIIIIICMMCVIDFKYNLFTKSVYKFGTSLDFE